MLLAGVVSAAPRYRGFNLLEMFMYGGSEKRFQESDFRMMKEWGFNFVRLPLDYRFWIKDGQWDVIDDAKLKPIDEAIAFGQKYGIHVQVCFHRIPGFTVARPAEARNLFADPEALKVACHHWDTFAKRYKDISNEDISFNLFNEPDSSVSEEQYVRVAEALVETIRAVSPKRTIVADGLKWGTRPCKGLYALGIEQATRGYNPMSVSHYKAPWVGTPSAEPLWPLAPGISPLYGEGKKPWNVPLTVQDLPAGTLKLRLGNVSGDVRLKAVCDGKTVLDQKLTPGGEGKWANVVRHEQWKLTQARYMDAIEFTVPASKKFTLEVAQGDWCEIERLDTPIGPLAFSLNWGQTNSPFRCAGGKIIPGGKAPSGLDQLREQNIEPWESAMKAGIPIMVGEFGSYNQTPHAVALAWLEDNLKLWKENNWGWALWNFRGTFGILDSQRSDVTYEDYQGHKLDRQMLNLLLKY